MTRFHLLIFLTLAAFASVAGRASAATFVVENTNNVGAGSLRAAISAANLAGGGDIIFTNLVGNTIYGGNLILNGHINIIGPGTEHLSVSGRHSQRAFRISQSSTSSISGLAIIDGSSATSSGMLSGGGIYNAGHLTLSNVSVINCVFTVVETQPRVNGGGGIGNDGTLIMKKCVVYANTADPDGGAYTTSGGGILNTGFLWMDECDVVQNRALSPPDFNALFSSHNEPRGGGIYNSGTLFVRRTWFNANTLGRGPALQQDGGPGGSGGGIFNLGTATVVESTISQNTCGAGAPGGSNPTGTNGYTGGMGGSGGGIWNGGTLALTNCTFASNSGGRGGIGGGRITVDPYVSGNGGPGGEGGGIYSTNGYTMVSCTLGLNYIGAGGDPGVALQVGQPGLPGLGGGLRSLLVPPQVNNSIIASNGFAGIAPDVAGDFLSLGHNLLGNSSGSSGFNGPGDLLNTNPLIFSIEGNGGPTLTFALPANSPARDAGDDALTGTDQRGYARHSGGHVDIGAYELQVPSSPPVITGLHRTPNGATHFSFTNTPGATFRVATTGDVATPGTNWTVLPTLLDSPTGNFTFTYPLNTNTPNRFFRVIWP